MDLIASTEGLAASSAAHAGTAAEVFGAATGTAVATTAVLPGTASPAVILGTTRVIAHGMNKLAVSVAGSALVGAIAGALADNGLAYEITEDANTAALTV